MFKLLPYITFLQCWLPDSIPMWSTRRWHRCGDIGLAAVVLVPIVVHWPELSGWLSTNPIHIISGLVSGGWRLDRGLLPGQPGWIDGHAGVTLQALGGRVARDWMSGRIPWWNPYSGVGLPLAAEMQPAAFFLPFVLLLRFVDGVLYLKITLQIVAGAATKLLLDQLGLLRSVATLGAVLFELNGTFAWFADPNMMPIPFLPLLVLAIERARAAARQRQRGGWQLIAVAVAYAITSGFPETAYLDGLLALAWAVCRVAQENEHRRALISKIVGGGIPGLLLTVPLLVPFGEYLARSSLEGHATLAHAAVPRAVWAMFLFPYVYGPIFFGSEINLWYMVGGFVSLPLLITGLYGAVMPGGERGLRAVLGAWVLVALAKTGDLIVISSLLNMIPPIREMMFFRYACASWEFAIVVLSAFGLDRWFRGARVTAPTSWAVRVGAAGCVTAVVFAGRTVIAHLWSEPDYPPYFIGSVVWGLTAAALLSALLSKTCTRRHFVIVCGVLTVDAIGQFSVPLFAGVRHPELDLGAVAYLKAHLGLQRFYTLGPLLPNYGAYFGLASVNHNYVPIDRVWAGYVRTHLDPGVSDSIFNGTYPSPSQDRWEAFQNHQTEFEAVGVRYVLVPSGWDLFDARPIDTSSSGSLVPLILEAGEGAHGWLPSPRPITHSIVGVQLLVGTYGGQSHGRLFFELCAADSCARGSARVDEATDNAPLEVPLASPLRTNVGEALRYRIDYAGSPRLAVWIRATTDGEIEGPRGGAQPHFGPQLWLQADGSASRPVRVYKGSALDIYELPHPAPYFTAAEAACHVTAISRTRATTDCSRPDILIRRELNYPGWRAFVNGHAAAIAADQGIFQHVAVPAGLSDIRFVYRPTYIGWAWSAAAVGLLWLLVGPAVADRLRCFGWCGAIVAGGAARRARG